MKTFLVESLLKQHAPSLGCPIRKEQPQRDLSLIVKSDPDLSRCHIFLNRYIEYVIFPQDLKLDLKRKMKDHRKLLLMFQDEWVIDESQVVSGMVILGERAAAAEERGLIFTDSDRCFWCGEEERGGRWLDVHGFLYGNWFILSNNIQ